MTDLFSHAGAALTPPRGPGAEAHRRFLESLPCLRCFVQLRIRTAATQTRAVALDDAAIAAAAAFVPVCAAHAAPGEPASAAAFTFERLGVDLGAVCAALWDRSGDRAAAERAFIEQANRARCVAASAPFRLHAPSSEEAREIRARFLKEEAIRV